MTTTQHYGFEVPDFEERRWDVPLNQTINEVDTALFNLQSGIPTLAVSSLQSGVGVALRGDIKIIGISGIKITFLANLNTIQISL